MSSEPAEREALFTALNAAMREASGLGVLFSQAVAQRLSMNSTDLECLDHVVTRGPLTAGALAAATGLTTGAITGVIDRLARAGLARREADPSDRRKVLVRATAAVGERIAPYFAPMARASMSVLAGRDEAELRLLLDIFVQMRDAALAALEEMKAMPDLAAKRSAPPTSHGAKLRPSAARPSPQSDRANGDE